jgi:hypothetical protein
MVSAWITSQRLVLGQVKVNEKSNEITAIYNRLARHQARPKEYKLVSKYLPLRAGLALLKLNH